MDSRNKKHVNFFKSKWRNWRGFILFVCLVFIPIRSSLADWNWVPSGSMNPTIMEGDMVYVNKLAYDLRFPLTLSRISSWGDPKAGDIVVCFSPDDGIRLVKRVIACPGDKVKISNNQLYVNNQAISLEAKPISSVEYLNEKYSRNGLLYEEYLSDVPHLMMHMPHMNVMKDFNEVIVPEGEYFVMGDNRDNSKDSRYFGFVKRKQIIGKATMVILSLDKLDKYQPRFSRFFTVLE